MASLTIKSGLKGQPSGKDLVITVNGTKFLFLISDNDDKLKCLSIMDVVFEQDERYRTYLKELVKILRKYDIDETTRMLRFLGDEGLALEMIGDSSKDLVKAKQAYEDSAMCGNPCGGCKVGRCYAEGRGCSQDRQLARQYLETVAKICSEAEQFLDWYGLR